MPGLRTTLAAATALAAIAVPAHAQESVKIGIITTLSGPGAALGQQLRNGFELGLKEMGNKIGGLDAELVVMDDEQKPDVAVNRAKELVQREDVDFVVGPIFSNIAQAIYKPITDAETFLVSPNAGPSDLAGAGCSPYFFATSYQNDQNHAVLGKYAQDSGIASVVLLVPNYQAGKDSVAGFKRYYEGEILDEIYTPLGQLDFSAELARIASLQPEALFTFMPGGMGVNLVKQFRQAGLADGVTFLSAFTVDESTLPAQQDAAVGLYGGSNWAPDMEQSADFVESYIGAYDAVPASYAMHAYDTVLLLDAAISAVDGDLQDKDALRQAIETAEFTSLRGDFSFGKNHFPVQDFYLVQVAQRDDGKFETRIVEKVFDDAVDDYADQCTMGE
ncbi:ABC transporter substrate-binding protein [Lutibaculum baratangense]|uniref:Benzoate transport, inner-membrane translocator n=1 Tax=Lutibaculum baratangense AMV1 TaxID=631454 RepID=V4TM48_9HYPH|nr:ABC transporter substrate-binding protein [Lutibaculum baratangense]ESR26843.1 Benzoate transport, inner-membrane translocator [Lutibaculum baratangense AMV1]